MRIALLDCASCDQPYALWRTVPRTEGASARLLLLCGCEGRALEVCVRDGRLAMREFPFAERERPEAPDLPGTEGGGP